MKSSNETHFGDRYLFSTVAIVGGIVCAVKGTGGFRTAYSSGPHVQIAGALLFVIGVLVLVSTVRAKRKLKNRQKQQDSEHHGA